MRNAIAEGLSGRGKFTLYMIRRIDAAREARAREGEAAIFHSVVGRIRTRGGQPSRRTFGATRVANQTDDLIALGREVSRLSAKVSILLGVAGASVLTAVGGAIALCRRSGSGQGLPASLGRWKPASPNRSPPNRSPMYRSEVGEIGARLSVMGQGPVPPR